MKNSNLVSWVEHFRPSNPIGTKELIPYFVDLHVKKFRSRILKAHGSSKGPTFPSPFQQSKVSSPTPHLIQSTIQELTKSPLHQKLFLI